MPVPLHTVVKNYIIDLLNKWWIKKSKSSYASPIVPVRKKDGSLGFCCNYRAFNAKTIPDRYLMSPVQDPLDHLFEKKMVLTIRSGKSIAPNIFRWRKSTFNSFSNSMGLVWIDHTTI